MQKQEIINRKCLSLNIKFSCLSNHRTLLMKSSFNQSTRSMARRPVKTIICYVTQYQKKSYMTYCCQGKIKIHITRLDVNKNIFLFGIM